MRFQIVLFLLTVANSLFAQKNISDQNHGWIMFFGNHRLTNKISLHTEYQWRRADVFSSWQQSLTRVGVDYRVADNVTFTVGYGYIVTWPYGEFPVALKFDEHRLWQTLTLTQRTGRFYFNHRFRLEQRWVENVVTSANNPPAIDGYSFKERIRYRFLVNVPLNKKNLEPGAVFLSVYDEPFLQFGYHFGANFLDQNRLYGAIGYVLNSHCNVQAGYMQQTVVKNDGFKIERNHTLQLAVTYNFDFRKKQPD
jgi:hypothetical protein